MKGYYVSYSYIGIMPDGSKREFASDRDYREAVEDEPDEDE